MRFQYWQPIPHHRSVSIRIDLVNFLVRFGDHLWSLCKVLFVILSAGIGDGRIGLDMIGQQACQVSVSGAGIMASEC